MFNRCDERILICVCVQIELIVRGIGERHNANLHIAGPDIERLRESRHAIKLLLKIGCAYRAGCIQKEHDVGGVRTTV
ncbi:hypothetical protein DPMN_154623 [Dreissena polymorpha]|uniref:Uncharacterized protein n=1 Tax=Dreissena polymorpha TaxID=45954 RepID=A0A9D4FKU4_DREPO|nr:hypothetical protein DPMN_154623 [Dreissena polymorpha]